MIDTDEHKYRKIDKEGNHYLLELNSETKELQWIQVKLKRNEI